MKKGICFLILLNLILIAAIILLLYNGSKEEEPIVLSITDEATEYIIIGVCRGDYEEKTELYGECVGEDCEKTVVLPFETLEETNVKLFRYYSEGAEICRIDGESYTAPSDLRLLDFKAGENQVSIKYLDYDATYIDLSYPAADIHELSYDSVIKIQDGEDYAAAEITDISYIVDSGFIHIRVKADVQVLPGTEVTAYLITEIIPDVVTLEREYVMQDNVGYYLWTNPENEDEKAEKVYYDMLEMGEDECIIDIDERYINELMRAEIN